MRESGAPGDQARFRLLRSEVCNALDVAKNQHIATRLAEVPTAEAKWRELRRLRISKSGPLDPLLRFDAATLNAHFATTVNRHPPVTEADFGSTAGKPLSGNLQCRFDFCPVTERQVVESLQGCSSKAMGCDGLPVPILKLASPRIILYVTRLLKTRKYLVILLFYV